MKPPKCMGIDLSEGMSKCWRPGFFRIKDMETSSEDGWSYFCDHHIGDHLARCVEGFDESFDKVKTVSLEYVP